MEGCLLRVLHCTGLGVRFPAALAADQVRAGCCLGALCHCAHIRGCLGALCCFIFHGPAGGGMRSPAAQRRRRVAVQHAAACVVLPRNRCTCTS